MPYVCNLDYVMFSLLGVPLFRGKLFRGWRLLRFQTETWSEADGLLAAGVCTGQRI